MNKLKATNNTDESYKHGVKWKKLEIRVLIVWFHTSQSILSQDKGYSRGRHMQVSVWDSGNILFLAMDMSYMYVITWRMLIEL